MTNGSIDERYYDKEIAEYAKGEISWVKKEMEKLCVEVGKRFDEFRVGLRGIILENGVVFENGDIVGEMTVKTVGKLAFMVRVLIEKALIEDYGGGESYLGKIPWNLWVRLKTGVKQNQIKVLFIHPLWLMFWGSLGDFIFDRTHFYRMADLDSDLYTKEEWEMVRSGAFRSRERMEKTKQLVEYHFKEYVHLTDLERWTLEIKNVFKDY